MRITTIARPQRAMLRPSEDVVWRRSNLRAPYELVFSQWSKCVRYRGVAKNQFAAFLRAMAFNLKRLLVLDLRW